MEETLEAGSSVARVAMKHGVNANQVFKWRRLHEAGRLGTRAAREVPLLPLFYRRTDAAAAVYESDIKAKLPRIRCQFWCQFGL